MCGCLELSHSLSNPFSPKSVQTWSWAFKIIVLLLASAYFLQTKTYLITVLGELQGLLDSCNMHQFYHFLFVVL